MTEPLAVRVRPLRPEDADALHAIRTQPGVADTTLGLPSDRVADSRGFFDALGSDDHLLVAVLDGEVVGAAGLHLRRGKQRHSASVGIMVREELQGRGIGRALLTALLDLADNWLGLTRVQLEVMAENERAIRLYERLGFEREGLKRKAVFRGGRFQDMLVMGRVR